MEITIALDVYGTLIDTDGIGKVVEKYVGASAPAFLSAWRSKQLEYTFRRGLMNAYKDFSVCTRDALEYACASPDKNLTSDQKNNLLNEYRNLPAFPEVDAALQELKSSKMFKLFAFSNGRRQDVESLLSNAGIQNYFDGIVSVDEVKTFKPDPAVYKHLLLRANSKGSNTWLVSGNPFDVIGAISAGLFGVWLKRASNHVFDFWEIQPSMTLGNLSELKKILERKL